mmetsp:Transcript_16688/g.40530  ORF Transcript_16688/g.40530 Transcript_16688/m.40530 type:complete len:105 (-) Transcript_16688:218-532(-)
MLYMYGMFLRPRIFSPSTRHHEAKYKLEGNATNTAQAVAYVLSDRLPSSMPWPMLIEVVLIVDSFIDLNLVQSADTSTSIFDQTVSFYLIVSTRTIYGGTVCNT